VVRHSNPRAAPGTCPRLRARTASLASSASRSRPPRRCAKSCGASELPVRVKARPGSVRPPSPSDAVRMVSNSRTSRRAGPSSCSCRWPAATPPKTWRSWSSTAASPSSTVSSATSTSRPDGWASPTSSPACRSCWTTAGASLSSPTASHHPAAVRRAITDHHIPQPPRRQQLGRQRQHAAQQRHRPRCRARLRQRAGVSGGPARHQGIDADAGPG
jgi:hypothetical protein